MRADPSLITLQPHRGQHVMTRCQSMGLLSTLGFAMRLAIQALRDRHLGSRARQQVRGSDRRSISRATCTPRRYAGLPPQLVPGEYGVSSISLASGRVPQRTWRMKAI